MPFWSYREWCFWRQAVPAGGRLLDLGSGRGKDAATVAGVLIGSSIGHDRAVRDADRYGAGREEVRTRTRCDVDDAWREEERIEGYDVTYEYMGDRYRTRLSHDPGDTLKVWVSVRPVGE